MGYDKGNAWSLFEKHCGPLIPLVSKLIEIGPGKLRRSLVKRFAEECRCEYHFADIKNYSDEHPGFHRMHGQFTIGADSETFDVAVMYEMLHNVWKPWRLLPEIVRLLKAGGVLCIVDNVTWDVNRYPVDCGRWFPDGMRALFDDAGLETVLAVMENVDGRELARKHQIGNALPVHIAAVGRKL